LAVLMLTGCPPKKKMPIEEKPAQEQPTPTESTEAVQPSDIQISQEWSEIPALEMVHFDFDSASVQENERAILKGNVSVLKKLPKTVTIRVEGHCDDRGTVEYNVALGQRRASAVANFYSSAGIAKSRIKTISFGEERPLCMEQSEGCWAQNRRGVTTVRNDQPLSIKPESLQ
jgi:peptidoglycan-associated lipoprotein